MAHSLDMEKTKLTQTVQKGGCAAKVAAEELRALLSKVQFPPRDPAVLVDGGLFDDAAIYKINEQLALVQTLDFFTPIVDSPRLFGEIAAANALSDVYAMGGEPKTAMAILAFPLATLPSDIIVEVLQGASDKMKEAGVSFVGGHSIDDDTLKFGLSVTGHVNPSQVWSNANAQEGDVLILTKPLGTGTCTAGLKRQELAEEDILDALQSMSTLNRIRDLVDSSSLEAIHAATDITGFGFLGHAQQMAHASNKKFEVSLAKMPLFKETVHCLEKGYLTKAHRTNGSYTEKNCETSRLTSLQKSILCDPQTSGGLLLSVAAAEADNILRALRTRFAGAQIIGEVKAPSLNSVAVEVLN